MSNIKRLMPERNDAQLYLLMSSVSFVWLSKPPDNITINTARTWPSPTITRTSHLILNLDKLHLKSKSTRCRDCTINLPKILQKERMPETAYNFLCFSFCNNWLHFALIRRHVHLFNYNISDQSVESGVLLGKQPAIPLAPIFPWRPVLDWLRESHNYFSLSFAKLQKSCHHHWHERCKSTQ